MTVKQVLDFIMDLLRVYVTTDMSDREFIARLTGRMVQLYLENGLSIPSVEGDDSNSS